MERSTELVEHIRSAKLLPEKKVFLPREQRDVLVRQAEEGGEIEIADAIWEELKYFRR